MRVFVMIGAILMTLNGCASNFDYKSYVCKDPDMGISSLDFLSGWAAIESRGSYGSYSQVQFIEPGRKGTTAIGSMSFTVQKSANVGVAPTLEAVVDDLMKKRGLLKEERVLFKANMSLQGYNAFRIDISYTGLDMPITKNYKPVKMREEIVVLYRDAKFYFFSYQNADANFDRYSKAFDRIVKSIRFK